MTLEQLLTHSDPNIREISKWLTGQNRYKLLRILNLNSENRYFRVGPTLVLTVDQYGLMSITKTEIQAHIYYDVMFGNDIIAFSTATEMINFFNQIPE